MRTSSSARRSAEPASGEHVREHLGRVLEGGGAHRDLGSTFGDVDRGRGIGDGHRGGVVARQISE